MVSARHSNPFLSSEAPHVTVLTQTRRVVAEIIETLAHTAFVVSPITTRGALMGQLASAMGPLAVILDLSLRREDPLEAIAMLGSLRYRGRLILLATRDWVRRSEAERLCEVHGIGIAAWLGHAEVGDLGRLLTDELAADGRVSYWALHQAIGQNRLRAFFQPQVNLASGAVVGAEALVRWRCQDDTIIMPDSFLAVADAGGMTPALTAAVFEQVVQAARELAQGTGTVETVSVNLSTSCLRDPALVEWLVERARNGDAPPGRIVLEITEGPDLNSDAIAGAARALHEVGYPLSLDDFGMAFSSLDRLARLPIRELKIDRAMVSRVIEDRRYRMILHAILKLANDLGIATCAEGVESAAVRDLLAELGCHTGQGWLFGRALPLDRFTAQFVGREAAAGPGCAHPPKEPLA